MIICDLYNYGYVYPNIFLITLKLIYFEGCTFKKTSEILLCMYYMAIRVVEFSNGGYKIIKIFA